MIPNLDYNTQRHLQGSASSEYGFVPGSDVYVYTRSTGTFIVGRWNFTDRAEFGNQADAVAAAFTAARVVIPLSTMPGAGDVAAHGGSLAIIAAQLAPTQERANAILQDAGLPSSISVQVRPAASSTRSSSSTTPRSRLVKGGLVAGGVGVVLAVVIAIARRS